MIPVGSGASARLRIDGSPVAGRVRRQARIDRREWWRLRIVRGLLRISGDPMASRDPTPESITLQTSIAETDRMLRMEPVVVGASASLRETAELAVQNTGCRVLAVVDGGERLVGVLPVRTLVNDVFLKLVPEEFLGEITDLEAAHKYAEHVGARTAGDIMLEPIAVGREDSVRIAFERMHEHKLNGLPIVDGDRRVVGYLDQLELLLVWVRATGRGSLLEPHDHGRPEAGAPV
jgi:CBS domain-containing protein